MNFPKQPFGIDITLVPALGYKNNSYLYRYFPELSRSISKRYQVIRAGKAPKFYLWGLGTGEFIRSDMSLVI
ncbi:MAG: hypothetical protein V7K67_07980, partial [Nostoc sp.]|uniref:hypothetical protein n=1 Tax=Nostoc sp. TaxID=1180 RepID=UPI002FFCE4D0